MRSSKANLFDGKMMLLDNVTYTLQGDICMMSFFQSQNDIVCKRNFDAVLLIFI